MESEGFNQKNESEDYLVQQFYKPALCSSSKNWNECALHLRKTYRELKSKPVPALFKSRLEGPSTAWKVFKRLSLAADYADSCTKDCMIFSFEERNAENTGQRLFLVTHPRHLWLNYKSRPPDTRCTYEVIRENSPCKLYFDLEFNKLVNPSKNGNEMTEIFIKCSIAAMLEVYNIQLNLKKFLWLDSSTEQKFSCHLILQLPDIAFQCNVVAGSFVSLLLSKIMDKIESNSDFNSMWPSSDKLKLLLVKKADGSRAFFCDSGVYTKNRNFRLYLSTKCGKRTPLLVSDHNYYVPENKSSNENQDELIFYDSLITYFRNNSIHLKLLNSPENRDLDVTHKRSLPNLRSEKLGFSQNGPSPFPEVDDFILTQVKDFTTVGFIRKWSYLEKEEILVYEIGNYRFCSNIGRHHKSNNIMLVVDWKKKNYYQKCHDPECRARNYKSLTKPLPNFIISLYSLPDKFFEAECFSQLKTTTETTNNSTSRIEINKNTNIENAADMVIADSFFDETQFFTQLNNNSKIQEISKTSILDEELMENGHTSETWIEDKDFDSFFLRNSEFLNETVNDKQKCIDSCDISSPKSHDNAKDKVLEKSIPDDFSVEDEIMMAEAAAEFDFAFEDSLISEETIF